MSDKTNRPTRRSVRLPGYNYAGPGTVFVTICTDHRRHLFGAVRDSQMQLNRFGEVASALWQSSFDMRPELIDHGWIVMPNHVHAMFSIDPKQWTWDDTPAFGHRVNKSVGAIVGGYKSTVTSQIRNLASDPAFVVWQRGFHEVIVRTEQRFAAIEQYIPDNPARWEEDVYRDEVP